jgi:hypothetical protein
MKITKQQPEKEYPYLAVWRGDGEPIGRNYRIDEIMVVNIQSRPDSDNVVWVQPLDGGKEGYVTKHENEYAPLPTGTIITITQGAVAG